MSDGLPCSRCPILDLGTKYPIHDERDPWRRMPGVFAAAVKVLGRSMYRHESRARQDSELRLGHYCKAVREKHGPCNGNRITVCQVALTNALEYASHADKPWPAAQASITRLVNDDKHHDRLKYTRIAPATPGMRMPPITLDRMEEVS